MLAGSIEGMTIQTGNIYLRTVRKGVLMLSILFSLAFFKSEHALAQDSVQKLSWCGGAYDLYSMKDGQRNGIHLSVNSSKDTTIRGYYKNSEKDGAWRYYSNRKPERIEMYVNGALNGLSIKYNPNGTESSLCQYESGVKSGLYELRYPDGTIKCIGQYCEGHRSGLWRFYYENGSIQKEGRYIDKGFSSLDTIVSNEDDGSITTSYAVRNYSLKEGNWHYFNEAGKWIRTEFYKNGILYEADED